MPFCGGLHPSFGGQPQICECFARCGVSGHQPYAVGIRRTRSGCSAAPSARSDTCAGCYGRTARLCPSLALLSCRALDGQRPRHARPRVCRRRKPRYPLIATSSAKTPQPDLHLPGEPRRIDHRDQVVRDEPTAVPGLSGTAAQGVLQQGERAGEAGELDQGAVHRRRDVPQMIRGQRQARNAPPTTKLMNSRWTATTRSAAARYHILSPPGTTTNQPKNRRTGTIGWHLRRPLLPPTGRSTTGLWRAAVKIRRLRLPSGQPGAACTCSARSADPPAWTNSCPVLGQQHPRQISRSMRPATPAVLAARGWPVAARDLWVAFRMSGEATALAVAPG